MGRDEGQETCLRTIITHLLRSGADPSKRVHNRTPLSLAVFDRDVEIVRLLLASGADVTGKTYSPFVEYKDRKGDQLGFYETALHAAVRGGYKEIVEELLKAGANPQDRDHSGVSVLELVRQTADLEMTELFKRHAKTKE
jgi:ankyrin repeat protein